MTENIEKMAKYFEEDIDRFIGCLPETAQILDVGCGPDNTGVIKKLLKAGHKITAIDTSPFYVKYWKEQCPEVKVFLMDMRNLEFDTHSFDGLTALLSIEDPFLAWDEHPTLLESFNRVLKLGGIMLLTLGKEGDDAFQERERSLGLLRRAGFNVISDRDSTFPKDWYSRHLIFARKCQRVVGLGTTL